jgi:hypothetical protein
MKYKGIGHFAQSLLHGETSVISLLTFVNWITASSKKNSFLGYLPKNVL